MHKFFIIAAIMLMSANIANAQSIKSVTIEGGPIATKHFQGDDENFRENHGLGIVKVETANYGTWGLYYLSPNSVSDPSFGAGYVTKPLELPLGPTHFELTGALGLVTGYQDYPVPLIAAQLKWVLFENETWDAGIAAAALPYIAEDPQSGDNDFGIVGTTPFLSVKRKF